MFLSEPTTRGVKRKAASLPHTINLERFLVVSVTTSPTPFIAVPANNPAGRYGHHLHFAWGRLERSEMNLRHRVGTYTCLPRGPPQSGDRPDFSSFRPIAVPSRYQPDSDQPQRLPTTPEYL